MSAAESWRRRGRVVLVIAGLTAFYLLTAPANRSEAEDAFLYAAQVESGELSPLLHRHHLLYGPMMRGLHLAVQATGRPVRAYPLMCAVGAFSAGVVVWLFHGIALRMMGRRAALCAAGLLAFSYGFWRYAAEAEIYAPASALGLAVVALSVRRGGAVRGVAGGLAGAAAISMHVMNVLPALVAVPLALAAGRGDRRRAAGQVVVTVLSLSLIYGAAWNSRSSDRGGAMGAIERTSPALLPVKAAIGLGQSVVSGNFLFGFGWFRDAMTGLFPYRELKEEVRMGQTAGTGTRTVPWATLALLALAGLALARTVLRRGAGRQLPAWAAERTDEAVVLRRSMGLWFVLYAAVALVFEAGNPEMWIMALPPFWLAVASWMSLRGAAPRLLLVTAALAAHNGAGGLRWLSHPEGDFIARKSEWVVKTARAGDTVLTTESEVFARYVQYWSGARVENLRAWPAGELPARYRELCRRPGRVFAFADVFDPPGVLRFRSPASFEALAAFAGSVRPEFGVETDDEFGGVLLRRPPPAQGP